MTDVLKSLVFGVGLVLGGGGVQPLFSDTLTIGTGDCSPTVCPTTPILEIIYKRAGIGLNLQTLPSKRRIDDLKSGAIDGLGSRIAAFSEIVPGLIRIEPATFSLKIKAYIRVGSDLKITKQEDLAGLRVAVRRGTIISLEAAKFANDIIELGSVPQMLQMLVSARVDVMVAAESQINVALATTELADRVEAVETILIETKLFHFLREEFATQAALLSAELLKLHESGEFDAITEMTIHEITRGAAHDGL